MIRSGGFAGIERRSEANTAGDPVLQALVRRVDLDTVTSSGQHADQFQYDIDIDGRQVTVCESQLTGTLRELVHHVLTHE
ncbi:MAG: protealysin inhibitor emfourin [Streptosporangiaceae bacterium]